MINRLFFFLIILLCYGCQHKDIPETIALANDWHFKNHTDSTWSKARVPGNVHSDLFRNNFIKNPFIGSNALELQWISNTDWEYRTEFQLDNTILRKKHIELNFEGLDTYATVYLNDSIILKSNNAFRTFHVDVTKLLKKYNYMHIIFEKTSTYETIAKAKLPYELPEGNRIFTRKTQFQYGWDWGPILNTSGIWRPITLSAWNDFKIHDAYIEQTELSDDLAKFKIDLEVSSSYKDPITYEIYVNGALNSEISKTSSSEINFQIENPTLWWPHNIGTPYLYDIKIIAKHNRTTLDTISIKKGIRTIELITDKDSIGQSFYFKVNGVDVFMKGSNYIPQHSLQDQVTPAHYEQLTQNVVDANMNMLRVWGGGIYEDDLFYDLCDEKGILVWQDFMFACAMYPGDAEFLENVKREALDNVKRLRNHASIALWCGNNENNEAWHNWGWQKGRSEAEKTEIWDNYLKVFDTMLPNIVKSYTNTDYWESSPKHGRLNPLYKTEGDAHDWWLWHSGYPFEYLEENVPRFMSEFGFQGFPSYEVMRFVNQSDAISMSSTGFLSHQKHIRGFELIKQYMQRDFPVPDQPEDYVYMSQLLQAFGMTKGFEAHRRARPYNMGTLYWQLNDVWPSVSWASLDYMGNWKALHYFTKKAFENVLISSYATNDTLKTYIINDKLQPLHGKLHIRILDFSGNELSSVKKNIEVAKNSSEVKHVLDLKNFDFDKSSVVIVTTFNDETSYYYLDRPKNLKLQNAKIIKRIMKTDTGFTIEISSNTLQKGVFLNTAAQGHFSDNFFDLLPNQTLHIDFTTEATSLKDLNIKTLNEFIDVEKHL
ncbi:beta-mannosidase [Gelidibacter salicanalis]|uniref:Beta-mannosidase B n=1 Tax=Gelidibacter salicanalis TaxID=291193 RepID=A0A934KPZ5_9FLAO|nr:glycoside hydrolase family 2 protein [Gelidibacter salicanalis]MBJ7881704.1 glycoside hydrolase family 2 protein [Gelidibacter salicanalis]